MSNDIVGLNLHLLKSIVNENRVSISFCVLLVIKCLHLKSLSMLDSSDVQLHKSEITILRLSFRIRPTKTMAFIVIQISLLSPLLPCVYSPKGELEYVTNHLQLNYKLSKSQKR